MKNIADIDSRLKVKTEIDKNDIRFYDVLKAPFKIYGVYYEDGKFRRLPEKVAQTVNPGVLYNHAYTTGGRIRFRTDSPYVAIQMTTEKFATISFQALAGTAGFDLYADGRHAGTFLPPWSMKTGFESVVDLRGDGMKEIIINMPIYGEVSALYIGLAENAKLEAPTEYKHQKPIVFYGSSITHGGCASRPGTAYPNMISRRFDSDIINLGFSGSAKGEDQIAEYIADLDMSVFVYDYDHNAPTAEHLENTYYRMFKIIRDKNPDLPVIMVTAPVFSYPDYERRRDIIHAAYQQAVNSGDKNVYFIDGIKMMEPCGFDGSVEGAHPTDLGFYFMAKGIGDVIEKIL